MKQLVPIGILIMLSYVSRSQDTLFLSSPEAPVEEDSSVADVKEIKQSAPVIIDTTAFYACYAGTIGEATVTVNLHKAGKEYSGYYYYDELQSPVYFSGYETETDSGEVIIYAEGFPGINRTERFYFNIQGEILLGICSKNKDDQPVPFTATLKETSHSFAYYYSKGRQRLFSSLRDGPKAEFSASSVWPNGENANYDFIKEFLLASFNADSSEEIIAPVLVRNKKQFFSKYRDEFKYTEPAYVIDVEYKFSRDNITDLLVCWHSDRILSLATHRFSYEGGSHGRSSKTYHNYDLSEQKLLTLDDIFQPGWDTIVNRLITQKLHDTYKLAPYETLRKVEFYEDAVSYSDNFYFTAKGIGFSYQPDEIAPYSFGQINVFIPFDEMKTVLQPHTVAQLSR